MTIVADLLRLSPRLVLIASIVGYISSKQVIFLRFVIYYLITELIAVLSKIITSAVFPLSMISRPPGAGNCKGCGVVAKSGDCYNASLEIGMPSGHSMTLTMASTFWILWVFQKTSYSNQTKMLLISMLSSVSISVMLSRTKLMENCHTIPQVVVGAFMGIGLGVLFYKLDGDVFSSIK